jgi:hypothetical protein
LFYEVGEGVKSRTYCKVYMWQLLYVTKKRNFFFFAVLGFELRAYTLSYSISPFCDFFFSFQDRVLWTICPGWLWTISLLISSSWVARIPAVNHQCPVRKCILTYQLCENSWAGFWIQGFTIAGHYTRATPEAQNSFWFEIYIIPKV